MVQVDRSLVLEHLGTKSNFEKQLYNKTKQKVSIKFIKSFKT